jgi:hypothetical protein
MLAEIRRAFARVDRVGGVSWNETWVRDGGMHTPEMLAEARASDKDRHWSELLDDERFVPGGVGGFSFLDAIGFRYYLPVVMSRQVAQPTTPMMHEILTLDKGRTRQYRLDQWALFDAPQRRAIARFLQFMAKWTEAPPTDVDNAWYHPWSDSLKSYWNTYI